MLQLLSSTQPRLPPSYELRFAFLFREGRAYAFPCDADGRVDLEMMSLQARNNYFRACSDIGRELAPPQIRVAA